jgi:hypothetical protein
LKQGKRYDLQIGLENGIDTTYTSSFGNTGTISHISTYSEKLRSTIWKRLTLLESKEVGILEKKKLWTLYPILNDLEKIHTLIETVDFR